MPQQEDIDNFSTHAQNVFPAVDPQAGPSRFVEAPSAMLAADGEEIDYRRLYLEERALRIEERRMRLLAERRLHYCQARLERYQARRRAEKRAAASANPQEPHAKRRRTDSDTSSEEEEVDQPPVAVAHVHPIPRLAPAPAAPVQPAPVPVGPAQAPVRPVARVHPNLFPLPGRDRPAHAPRPVRRPAQPIPVPFRRYDAPPRDEAEMVRRVHARQDVLNARQRLEEIYQRCVAACPNNRVTRVLFNRSIMDITGDGGDLHSGGFRDLDSIPEAGSVDEASVVDHYVLAGEAARRRGRRTIDDEDIMEAMLLLLNP